MTITVSCNLGVSPKELMPGGKTVNNEFHTQGH